MIGDQNRQVYKILPHKLRHTYATNRLNVEAELVAGPREHRSHADLYEYRIGTNGAGGEEIMNIRLSVPHESPL